jgi:hypothetical protein
MFKLPPFVRLVAHLHRHRNCQPMTCRRHHPTLLLLRRPPPYSHILLHTLLCISVYPLRFTFDIIPFTLAS